MIPRYPTMEQIYEQYERPYKQIIFEGQVYNFSSTQKQGEVSQHIYRNEEEHHTLTIHTQGSVPFYVDAWYIIQEEFKNSQS